MTDRLFVAAFPPQEVTQALERFVEPRRDLTRPWNWSLATNWHVTLAFLGDVDADRQDPLAGLLADVARTTSPFRLTMSGGLALPNPAKARVLALAGTGGVAELTHLAGRVRAACSRAGTPPDGARFTPHLTLARANRPAAARTVLQLADSFGEFAWEVAEIVLVASTLNRGGSRYQAVGRYQFASPSTAGAQ